MNRGSARLAPNRMFNGTERLTDEQLKEMNAVRAKYGAQRFSVLVGVNANQLAKLDYGGKARADVVR